MKEKNKVLEPLSSYCTFCTITPPGKAIYHFYWNFPIGKDGEPEGLPDISDTEDVRTEIKKFWRDVERLETGVML